jgi:hypothetical protein
MDKTSRTLLTPWMAGPASSSRRNGTSGLDVLVTKISLRVGASPSLARPNNGTAAVWRWINVCYTHDIVRTTPRHLEGVYSATATLSATVPSRPSRPSLIYVRFVRAVAHHRSIAGWGAERSHAPRLHPLCWLDIPRT